MQVPAPPPPPPHLIGHSCCGRCYAFCGPARRRGKKLPTPHLPPREINGESAAARVTSNCRLCYPRQAINYARQSSPEIANEGVFSYLLHRISLQLSFSHNEVPSYISLKALLNRRDSCDVRISTDLSRSVAELHTVRSSIHSHQN